MRLQAMILAVIGAVVAGGGIAAVVLWLNQPDLMHYRAEYWDEGMFLGGRGSGYYQAEYNTLSVHMPQATAWHQAQGRALALSLHMNGEQIPVDTLTRDRIQQLGAVYHSTVNTSWASYEIWTLRSDRTNLRFNVTLQGDLQSISLSHHHSHPDQKIAIGWDGKSPFSFPISDQFMVDYFGRPSSRSTSRSFWQ